MDSTTVDIVLVIAFLLGMALLGVALLGVSLRVGPRRGTWNQPAAMLVRPGRRMVVAMYALAAVHVLLGLALAIAAPGGGIAILLVLVAMGTFYVMCAHSFQLAHSIRRRRES